MRSCFILVPVLCWMMLLPARAEMITVKSDPRFVKLQQALPAGWVLFVNADTLIIENTKTVWCWNSNFINAPLKDLERSDANRDKILENGVETVPTIAFVLKNRKMLNPTELTEANYMAKHYALFELRATGFDTPFTRYYPYNLEEEASRIYHVLLGEYLKKVRGPEYAG